MKSCGHDIVITAKDSGATYSSELVTVEDMEDFAIEHYINTKIEVLPVPQLSHLIARNTLPLDQLSLWNTTSSVDVCEGK